MKPISSPLIALFATRQFNSCGLYLFSLIGGGQLYYSSADADVVWGGHTYSSGGSGGTGPYLDTTNNKAKLHQKIGTAVDTLTFDVIPGAATINGESFLSAVRQGVFDGAELTYSGAYWPQQAYANPIVPTGTIVKMVGRVAEVDAGRSLASFTVNSHLELLNQQMPRNLYQSACTNTFCDAGCTLNIGSFSRTGIAVLSGSTANTINATLTPPGVSFALGTVTFSSGQNAGVSRTIKSYTQGTPSVISLISPFPSIPAVSDTFTISEGCDKQLATCNAYDNLINYRGTPFIPDAATAI